MRVIWDQPEPCPYLPGQTARMPIRSPGRMLTGAEFDACLANGDRRSGRWVYKTACPACSECRSLRVPVNEFTPTSSQRRIFRKNSDLDVWVAQPSATEVHLRLYNRHKLERGLARRDEPATAESYSNWLVDSCTRTVEIRYMLGERLLAVSILDIGATAASSVYHYFDPDDSPRSLGVYSVLCEIAWCREQGLTWYYMGYYVKACDHLNYKANYGPYEVLTDAGWVRRA